MKQADAIERTPRAIKTKAPATKKGNIKLWVFSSPEVKLSNVVFFCILVSFMAAAGFGEYMSTTINTAVY
jgi:hypothetical protein